MTFLILTLAALPAQAGDVLETDGFSTCLNTDTIVVNKMNIRYDKLSGKMKFDVAGTSKAEQKVSATLKVTAYGRDVYTTTFDPCEKNITQLCPIPKGYFAANDSLEITPQIAAQIPDIAFKIPDLDGVATLQLKSKDNGTELACLTSVVKNGKTASVTEAKYLTASIAAAALLLSGLSALGSGAGASAAGASPNFAEVMFWFQGIACDGMLSLSYPSVYRSFTDNFQWSTGLVTWDGMQKSIDGFREKTGGNTTHMSIEYLQNNMTLVYDKFLANGTASTLTRRGLDDYMLRGIFEREINASINGTKADGTTVAPQTGEQGKVMTYVKGIQAKVETLMIPSANTFMTVLLIFCIVIAGVAVCILLFKVILEFWALFASFPKSLTGFRKRYWGFLLSTIVRIILILYGTWTLYCLYQFKSGDSWGAHALAGITLFTFTAILAFFAWRIFTVARHAKMSQEGQEQLFVHKPYMRKYGLFYDQFKSNFWWIFLPLIVYAFAKGAFIALGDGHGLIQTIGQLSCEMMLLILLLWNRPYNTKAGNVLNIIISCVRVLSVVCLIVFVDQLGIAPDTKTVTGVALIAIQSILTGVLAICIAVNAIYAMCKENPHVKKRKEQEKLREAGDLTALDARNSLLSGPYGHDGKGQYQKAPVADQFYFNENAAPPPGTIPMQHMSPYHTRDFSSTSGHSLMNSAAPMPIASPPQTASNFSYDNYQRPSQNYQGPPQSYQGPPQRGPYEEYRNQFPPSHQGPGAPRVY
ncbi:hypothetical protein BDD12DRAFT_749931 [Trichophaea hybrida]|nr:hypothetical protein BDD12DRAFT_749931 [Trichophaea hybrida]